jgi:hypothetical protein
MIEQMRAAGYPYADDIQPLLFTAGRFLLIDDMSVAHHGGLHPALRQTP